MNYIREIRGFYEFVEDNELRAGQIALWHALMHKANRGGWEEWFRVSDKKLAALAGLGRTTIWDQLKELRKIGLIDYRTGKGNKKEFKMISCSKFEHISEQEPEQHPEQHPEHPLIERALNGNENKNCSFVGVTVGVPRARKRKSKLKFGGEEVPADVIEYAEQCWKRHIDEDVLLGYLKPCYSIFCFAKAQAHDTADWSFKEDLRDAIESTGINCPRNPEAYITAIFKKWYADFLPDFML